MRHRGVKRQIVAPLDVVFQTRQSLIGREIAVESLDGIQQIVRRVGHIALPQLVDVIGIGGTDAVYGELSRMIFLADERIFEFRAVFPLAVLAAIGHISPAEHVVE